jgi:hypothetical protein
VRIPDCELNSVVVPIGWFVGANPGTGKGGPGIAAIDERI